MQKRYQVLLPDWLESYIKFLVDQHNFSFSEVIRLLICTSSLLAITRFHPEYKPDISFEEIFNPERKVDPRKMRKGELNKLMSKIYFETRKAVEFQIAQSETKQED